MRLEWKYVDESFLDWLRNNYEKRIPFSDYGDERFKPFFGTLFEVEDLIYVTQITSPKPRHQNMKRALDFYKVYHPDNNGLIAVVNLNFMFPVHKDLVESVIYKNIEKYRSFIDEEEKGKYIDFLRLELKEVNKLKLIDASQKIYKLKYEKPNDKVSLRCFDFKNLEIGCKKYISIL